MTRTEGKHWSLKDECTFSCLSTLKKKEHPHIGQKGYSRVVHCNAPDDRDAIEHNYRGNYVSTTKYTASTFVPKSLFEQFRRVANLYFLVVGCVSFALIAPYAGVGVLLPSILVMAKEGLEDLRRMKQDIEANNRKVEAYDNKKHKFEKTTWKKLRVGHVVKVYKDEYFPADLLLLSSDYEDGICYVETSNLDGEANLKLKHALKATAFLRDETSLTNFNPIIKCEDPNDNLYSFVGTLEYQDRENQFPLSLQQLLLRGSKLRNTDWIYGVVVFTGHDTKVMQNSVDPPSKRSKIERRMDKIIYLLFSILMAIALLGSLFFGVETKKDIQNGRIMTRWYLRPDDTAVFYDPKRPFLAAVFHFLTGLTLYDYLIPISLYVSIEIVKMLQCVFINQDENMVCDETKKPARARTSNLNEELGQVDTILSDKTGTLTCNSMEFMKCSIAGVAYGRGMTEVELELELARRGMTEVELELARRGMTEVELELARSRGESIGGGELYDLPRKIKGFNFNDDRILNGNWVNQPHPDVIEKFFRVLAVCHTAVPDVNRETGEISYEAESPDEAAFVVAAKEVGFDFYERTRTIILVREPDVKRGSTIVREYKLLHVIEFTSHRKRMSVIVKTDENKILLLTKGADNVIFNRLSEKGRAFVQETKEHMNKYAEVGLRTLAIAYRELKEEEFKDWEEEISKAKASLAADRDDKVEEVADKIERDLILLGATAVEDKLQKDVSKCIERLGKAGIKIWLLTGDKMETAINIGYACRLLKQGMKLIVVSLDSNDIIALEKRDEVAAVEASFRRVREQIDHGSSEIRSNRQRSTKFGLIIDGKSLAFALDLQLKRSFFELAVGCASVICCRSSPKQKALVTRMVKVGTGRTTLAIGDGANDVGMLQEADIGVGISGVEGMQAVMASDFSIAQFRFLERLLLVHGHWCYRRLSMMICYFFYKNITFGFTLFWFEAFASFSGTPAYNDWYMSVYNVLFTSLPVIAIGVFDQDVSDTLCLMHPRLYAQGPKNVLFSWTRILGWIVNGIASSILIFWLTTAAILPQAFRGDGRAAGMSEVAATMYSCVVWVVNCQMAISINYFTWIQHLFIWGSIGIWYVFLIVYGYITPVLSTTAYAVFLEACAPSPLHWLVVVVALLACLLPYFVYRAFQTRLCPMYHDRIQQGLAAPDSIIC